MILRRIAKVERRKRRRKGSRGNGRFAKEFCSFPRFVDSVLRAGLSCFPSAPSFKHPSSLYPCGKVGNFPLELGRSLPHIR